jgi:hypothetical protein
MSRVLFVFFPPSLTLAVLVSDRMELLLSKVYYPNKLTKALYKLGLDTEELVDRIRWRSRL